MKVQYASDLHIELIRQWGYTGIEPSPTADVLVLAGDIHYGSAAVDLFKAWPVPVVYVFGNHDLWGCDDLDQRIEEMRTACEGTSIHFLERDAVVIGGVRFLGTTLWTDYLLGGVEHRDFTMDHCTRYMNDHRLIRIGGYGVTAEQLLTRHQESVAWLSDQLAEPFTGKTVVVTHHGPHEASLVKWQKDEYVKAAYASDLTRLMSTPDLWLHGHVHVSVDYFLRNTRIATNPRGYPHVHEGSGRGWIKFQNKSFDREKTIDLEQR